MAVKPSGTDFMDGLGLACLPHVHSRIAIMKASFQQARPSAVNHGSLAHEHSSDVSPQRQLDWAQAQGNGRVPRPLARRSVLVSTMILSVIRRVLISLAIAALASACIMPSQAWDWVFGGVVMFKELIALRVVLVGLSGVLTAIWYY
jgi:hypothetical protein